MCGLVELARVRVARENGYVWGLVELARVRVARDICPCPDSTARDESYHKPGMV
jgi:hypothetical protein